MKKIDLTKTITEFDGKTPYSFGKQQGKDADGNPMVVNLVGDFKTVVSENLRKWKSQPRRGEGGKPIDHKAEVQKIAALARKVAACNELTEWDEWEINIFDLCMSAQNDIIYAQFLDAIE